MPDYTVLDELAAYLIAQGVGQAPGAQPSATLPSIWKQPIDGAALPGRPRGQWTAAQAQAETATITLEDEITGSRIGGGLDGSLEETVVRVVVRSKTEPAGKLLHRTVRGLIHPVSSPHARTLWMMGALLVEYSMTVTGDQPHPPDPDGNHDTYTRSARFLFGCRRKALAGQPYAP